ncbi:MAG: UDP-N-acetylmuramoyl-tripeptide--D-alanyl-D-alanine ligase, partial [Planctomycetes bacterium]|nr:UDP-N-acetylmuramoyl-tripeptide--D-alanyl-D-alanine ligase [Planctomycetota bacterium]
MVTSMRLEDSKSWMTPARIAKCCGGRVVRSGAPATRVVTNSGEVGAGAVFVALPGAVRDGHEFVADALGRGAAGVIVSKPIGRTDIPEGCFAVRVPDTLVALQALAAEHRRRHQVSVVGITGSCGKTSTKDMLGAVLARVMPATWSPKSYNNHVGVPLSLLQIDASTQAAVVEIGTSAPGEIRALADLAEPDIGIVTCVAEAHLSGLGSIDGVAKEKASLLAGLRPGGVAILNGDDRKCRAMASECERRTVIVSAAGEADWFATDVRFHGIGTSFRLQGERPVTLPRLGTHNVYNALMVIAAATELGVELDDVLAGLTESVPSSRRMECHTCGDVTVFDDTYNMNPDSSRAALSALAGL